MMMMHLIERETRKPSCAVAHRHRQQQQQEPLIGDDDVALSHRHHHQVSRISQARSSSSSTCGGGEEAAGIIRPSRTARRPNHRQQQQQELQLQLIPRSSSTASSSSATRTTRRRRPTTTTTTTAAATPTPTTTPTTRTRIRRGTALAASSSAHACLTSAATVASPSLLSVLAWSLTLLLVTSCLGIADAGTLMGHPFSKRSFMDIQCKGVYDKSLFARLDRICEDCYNLFREPQLHTLCRKNCFTSDYFKGCLDVLLLEDEMEWIQTSIKQLHGADPGV